MRCKCDEQGSSHLRHPLAGLTTILKRRGYGMFVEHDKYSSLFQHPLGPKGMVTHRTCNVARVLYSSEIVHGCRYPDN